LTEHDLLRTENSKINLTIWDLPLGTRKEQIRRLLVSFGKVISCDLYWTYNGSGRAEVEICTSSAELDKKIKDTWALPFLGNRMVRVTSEDFEKVELVEENSRKKRRVEVELKDLENPMGINLKRRGSNSFKPRIEIIGRKRIMPGRAEEERQDRERKNINKRVGTEQIYDQETP
ncbi:13435_t:CDS:2, partial [Gigaspora rosea]